MPGSSNCWSKPKQPLTRHPLRKYNGHRERAIVHILDAIKELEAAGIATKSKDKGKGKSKRGAGQGSGPMKVAIRHMDQAIVQLEAGIRYYEAHAGAGAASGAGGLAHVLTLVTKAKQLALKKK
jgi:hypothetical protein